jgi:hypothetical protein
MPKFELTLTHTVPGASPNNPLSVPERQARALNVARKHDVHVITQPTNTTNPFTWKVEGSDDKVTDMINEWVKHGNVTVTKSLLP